MKDQFIAAAASIESHPARLDDNLDRIGEACRRAANLGAELLLLPELSLTGFIPNHPRMEHASWLAEALAGAWRMALPLQGLAVKRLIELAGRSGLLVAAGFLESTGNTLYNTHVLVGGGRIYVIVCGHYNCGGVKNAMSRHDLGLINKWLRHIKDVYRHNRRELETIESEQARWDRLVELNVAEQVQNLVET